MDVQMQDATPLSTPSIPQLNPSLALSSTATPSTSAQIDPAKLEAIRKATLNSYKNKFLNLRDKFDKVNTTNAEYTTTLEKAKKKEEAIQEEINMLLDYLALHGSSDPEIARCLTRPPTLPSPLGGLSSRTISQNGA